MGVSDDPVMRDKLMKVYIHSRVESFTNRRAADLARSGTPGPEGSLGKLLWTEGMNLVSDVIGDILGPSLVADTGQWGTFAWNSHLLGAPGYRIGGGSDEVSASSSVNECWALLASRVPTPGLGPMFLAEQPLS